DRGGKDGRVEGGDGDVVDVETHVLQDRAGGVGVAGRERARQREGAQPLFVGEALVAGREGEPVGIANRGKYGELELEMQVGDHPSQHLDLLRVLLAEVDDVGTDDREELEAHGGDAAEVSVAMLALEDRTEL